MSFQMSSLEMKAAQNRSKVDAIRKKTPKTLKDMALQEEERYQEFKSKRTKGAKKPKLNETLLSERLLPDDFGILPPRSYSSMDKEEKPEPTSEKKVLQTPPSKLGSLPSLYQCSVLLKERVHLIRYDSNLYCYNGKCYDILDSNDVISLYRDKVDTKLGNERSLSTISQLHKFLCSDSSMVVEGYKRNKKIAVLQNGIYDVMGEELLPHSHEEVVFSYINANYDEHGKCPYFDRFLYDVTEGNEILYKRLWMFLGYTFMQTNEAKAFFVMGEAPDSGKSLLGNFIESVYPKKYVSNIALMDFNRNFAMAPLAGSAVNISLDLPSSRLNSGAVSRIKMLTGGDTLNIQKKFVNDFRYENQAKLIFASNFPISLIEPDNAFWNRLVYLPFDRSVPKARQDRGLAERFQRERDAIISKALHYAKQLVLSDFCFPTTPYIERKMQEWQGKACATIENFISECCICNETLRGELVDTLYRAYSNYCDDTGYAAKNRYIFKRFLEEQMGLIHFKMRDGGENPQSAFKGISIRDSIRK